MSKAKLDCRSQRATQLFIFKPADCMISFDVVSLFTNVPLIEIIDIISDYVYKSKSKPTFVSWYLKNF